MGFFEKIRNRPERERNILFWVFLIISVLIVGFFWVKSLGGPFEKLKSESEKIDTSSQEAIDQAKKEASFDQLNEAMDKLKDFLKSEKVKDSLEESETKTQ